MPPFPDDAGMLQSHVDATIRVAQERNTFIFIRPTTLDSKRLIGYDYPTKSMDIHSKSSDWGPMAGFVPVNPAFDKKRGASPGHPPFDEPEAEHDFHLDHDEATTCQLVLTPALLDEFNRLGKVTLERDTRWSRPEWGMTRRLPELDAGGAALRGRAVKDDREYHFFFWRGEHGWLVWYEDRRFATGSADVKAVRPLDVWAYRVGDRPEPVTGDYDLWMVAPYRTALTSHVSVELNADPHGPSAATKFITTLIPVLNTACRRAGRPVYRHGAESQNYTFTQAIDKDLAMFYPNGGARMVKRADLPRILTDIRNRGYIVYANKRYLESDPRLMGTAMTGGQAELEALRRKVNRAASAIVDWKQRNTRGRTAPKLALAARAVVRANAAMQAHNAVGTEQASIALFAAELVAYLRLSPNELYALVESDFPRAVNAGDIESRRLRRALEAMVVDTTAEGKDRLNDFIYSNMMGLLELAT